MVVTAVFCVLYAMSDEFHQGFVPGRVCSWKDVLFFDTLGVGLMAFIMDRWYKR